MTWQRSRPHRLRILVLVAGASLAGSPAPAAADATLADALKMGTPSLDLRYRFEGVNQDGLPENARASTARLRLGYRTGDFHGFFAASDLEHIRVIGAERYNSTANGLAEFPVVADPEGTEVNQAYLGYSGLTKTTFRLGRQRIKLDNLRFVGNVGWRQNEQTYDAFSVRSQVTRNLSVFYARVENINRVFGEDNPNPLLADLQVSIDLGEVSYAFPAGTLSAYAHQMEFEDLPQTSHRNLGLRFKGDTAAGEQIRILYTAEFTDQSNFRDAPSTVDANYLFAELGLGFAHSTFKLGYEVLGGNGAYGFSTPLATLHAFNGWADQFLRTPLDGLRDFMATASGRLAGFSLTGVYHRFNADRGNADYGQEVDLQIVRTFKDIYTAGLKYAHYDADAFATDTDKFWVTLQVKF
ncbi:MAG: alginate export family protein [Acidobacteriota bacterium]